MSEAQVIDAPEDETEEFESACLSCTHWAAIVTDDEETSFAAGLCRRMPPRAVSDPETEPRWPVTSYNECCGEYEADEELLDE